MINDNFLNEKLLTPFGTKLYANIGEFYSLYCVALNSSNSIIWTLPNGTRIDTNKEQVKKIKFKTKYVYKYIYFKLF